MTTQNNGASLTFTGYKNGSQFTREYIFPDSYPCRANNYYIYTKVGSGVLRLRSGGGAQTAKVKFYNIDEKGWADFQLSDYGFTLKLALTNQ